MKGTIKREKQYSEDKYRTSLKNIPIETLDGDFYDSREIITNTKKSLVSKVFSNTWSENIVIDKDGRSIFDDFFYALKDNNLKVSLPERLDFLAVIKNVGLTKDFLFFPQPFEKVRTIAKTTLIKYKEDEKIFDEIFDSYFLSMLKKIKEDESINGNKEKIDFNKEEKIEDKNEVKDQTEEQEKLGEEEKELEEKTKNTGDKPDIKEQLGIKEINTNLDSENDFGDYEETVHGGNKDQHNDILQKKDISKQGGGEKKPNELQNPSGEEKRTPQREEKPFSMEGLLIGGGEGNAKYVTNEKILYNSNASLTGVMQERIKNEKVVDRRLKHKKRPDKFDIRQIVRQLRRVIVETSGIRSSNLNVKETIHNLAKNQLRFEFNHEREKAQEIVLFVDVGGPVDEGRHIITEVTQEMSKGLSKLEVYLFHNNLYGYVWKYNTKNTSENYANSNSLLSIKDVVNHRKKVIIYGDAKMSYSEMERDMRKPQNNENRIKKYGCKGNDCLNYIKKTSKATVRLNPFFKSERDEKDDSKTIAKIGSIIPMYDLTVGGVEDAISYLLRKK